MPMIRAALLRRADWSELAEQAVAAQFGRQAAQLSQQRLERMLRSFEIMCGMEEQQGEREVSRGGAEPGAPSTELDGVWAAARKAVGLQVAGLLAT